jgi:hypothetical protein
MLLARGHIARHETRSGANEKGASAIALGHMPSHMTTKIGARTDLGGCGPITLQSGFLKRIWFFLIITMPIISRFTPFLGDIGHFWRPDSWRKLGM